MVAEQESKASVKSGVQSLLRLLMPDISPPRWPPRQRNCLKADPDVRLNLHLSRALREDLSIASKCCQRWTPKDLWQSHTLGHCWLPAIIDSIILRSYGMVRGNVSRMMLSNS